jgi:hypothetical protein
VGGNDIGLTPPDALRPRQDLAVKSALKASLDRELAQEASARRAVTAQHLASPGRCTPADTHAAASSR